MQYESGIGGESTSDPGPEMNDSNALGRILLWDLAGTILVHDEGTRRSGPLPGLIESLPLLAKDYRMVVATGEGTGSARSILTNYELLPFFEEIFGDLLSHGGKPHGEILQQMGGQPELSLVIGDRLRGDLPTDCDDLVTLLINQEGEILDAGLVAATIHALRKMAPTMTEAFRGLTERAETDPESLGPRGGGMVTAAWRSNELSGARLWIFEPDWLEARRAVIVL